MRSLLLVAFLATEAYADPNAFLSVEPPHITATIYGRSTIVTAGCSLQEGEANIPAVAAPDTEDPPVAIAFLFLGNAMFSAGLSQTNNWALDDEHSQLSAWRRAIDHDSLPTPPGSRFEIISYGAGARVIYPWSPIKQLHAGAFGKAKDYERVLGSDLATGVQLALDELDRQRSMRKILVIYGDGTDTDSAKARDAMFEFAERARRDHVETYGVMIKHELSSETMVLPEMIGDAQLVSSREGITAAWKTVIARAQMRNEFTFDASDLAWDGLQHDIALVCPNQLHVDAKMTLPEWSSPRRVLTLPHILLGGGVIALLVALLGRRR